MAHPQQREFLEKVKGMYPDFFLNTAVLEIGSLNINGTVRDFFDDPFEYVGVDLAEGPDVDVVCKGHEIPFYPETFNVAISCECFEHDKHWKETFQKMYDTVVKGGLIIFSCATTGRPEHGTQFSGPWDSPFTNDYYRNLTADDFMEAFDINKMFRNWEFTTNNESHDLYFWGLK